MNPQPPTRDGRIHRIPAEIAQVKGPRQRTLFDGARTEEVSKTVEPKLYFPDTEVWSCGGGTQSCAIAALIIQGRLPKPDISVIADTGREMPTTWLYLDSILRPALAEVGVKIHRISTAALATPRGRDMFATSGQLMIPAYTNQSGEDSKLGAFCSGAWKQEVVDRWLSVECGKTRTQVRKWIGYSFDEDRRVLRCQGGKEFKSGIVRLPLVQDVPLRRHEAISVVQGMGWPKPPRSRCWMCPNQSDMEWAEVKTDYPQLFAEAISLDEWIRKRDPHAFLHSSVKPLREAELDPKEDLFSAGCANGECFL